MENRPPVLIDTIEKLDEALAHWKNTTFSQHYFKLDDAVESLRKPSGHLVVARQEFATRWVLCPPRGKKPATFWAVGVWRWNSDLDTGNFVPPGEIAPARLPESRIQTMPNNLCRFTYVLDTTHDKSLWEAQEVFEEYLKTVNKFNPGKKARRKFQNGLGHTHTFHLSTQIFLKRTAYTRTKEASRSYPLHEWINNATKKGMPYFANNEKPVLFEPDEQGGLRPLSECFPPTLKVGDLVWMSFSVEFFIGNMYWSTNFILYEFVRVGSVALELLPEIKKEFEEGEEEEGPRERLGVGMRGITAAQARELNAVVDTPPVLPAEQAANISTEPDAQHTATETNAAGPAVAPDSETSRNVLLSRPRSPHAFIDSESEERTATTSGDNTDEEEIDSGIQVNDDESMAQEYLSMDDDSFIVDDDSSLTDAAASFSDDDMASFIADDDNAAPSMDDEVSPVRKDASVAEPVASAADGKGSVAAQVSSPLSSSKLIKQLSIVNRAEVAKKGAADVQASPKPKGRKRAASSERLSEDAAAGTSVIKGDWVLRKRVAKGKGVAK